MLFGHPYIQEACQIKLLLTDFSTASKASINKAKSQILFFHTTVTTEDVIARIHEFPIVVLPSKYLGAPMIASVLRNSSWNILLERLEACLSSWTRKALNMASRLVLIKFVLQYLMLYLFSILSSPKWVLNEIKHLQRSFLWAI